MNRDVATHNYTLRNEVDHYIPRAINSFIDKLPMINFPKVQNEIDESIEALPN